MAADRWEGFLKDCERMLNLGSNLARERTGR